MSDDVTLIRNEYAGYDVYLGTRMIGTVERWEETYMQDRHRRSRRLTHAKRWHASPASLGARTYGTEPTRRAAVAELVRVVTEHSPDR